MDATDRALATLVVAGAGVRPHQLQQLRLEDVRSEVSDR